MSDSEHHHLSMRPRTARDAAIPRLSRGRARTARQRLDHDGRPRSNPTTASRVAMGIANDLSSDGRPRQHAPNVMHGRLNPTTRVARAHRNAAGQHLDPALQPSLTPTSITISAGAREPRATPQSHDSRVGGHVDDPSPTAVHIRCYRATSTRSRLRTMSIFVFCSIGSGEPRAWPQSHGARVDGRAPHVSDSSPTVVHIRCSR